ncbi:hypothetical protein A3SI_15378, partial [Nitritalea halalkaliphila LW7]
WLMLAIASLFLVWLYGLFFKRFWVFFFGLKRVERLGLGWRRVFLGLFFWGFLCGGGILCGDG